MNRGDDLRSSEDQQVDVVRQPDRVIAKPFAANRTLIQLLLLDHRPHRAIEDQDPTGQQRVECRASRHQLS
jgi:hypothetical protein